MGRHWLVQIDVASSTTTTFTRGPCMAFEQLSEADIGCPFLGQLSFKGYRKIYIGLIKQ